jgi:hypothetical protein
MLPAGHSLLCIYLLSERGRWVGFSVLLRAKNKSGNGLLLILITAK